MPFKIIKQTLSELMNNKNIPGPNRFHIQIRLLHSEVRPSQSSKEYYTNCATWESKEFIGLQEQETGIIKYFFFATESYFYLKKNFCNVSYNFLFVFVCF